MSSSESNPVEDDAPAVLGTKPSRGRLVAQLLGFLACLAALGWCVSIAFAPANREQIAKLADATPGQIAGLLGLSGVMVVLNGLVFWTTIRAEKKLDMVGVLSTKVAPATALAYLPFKLGLATRIFVHARRDGLGVLTIGAWFAGVGVLLLCVLGSVTAAAFFRRESDWVFVVMAVGLSILGSVVVWGVASRFTGEAGLDRVRRIARAVPIGIVSRLVETKSFMSLHAVLRILAHPSAVIGSGVLRLGDIGVQAARFVVAASVLGIALPTSDAIILSVTYFLAGVFSPVGMLGSREVAAVGVAIALGLEGGGSPEDSPLTIVILFVTATESIATLALGAVGGVIIRPDRLVVPGRKQDLRSIDEDRAVPDQSDDR